MMLELENEIRKKNFKIGREIKLCFNSRATKEYKFPTPGRKRKHSNFEKQNQ